MKKLTTLACMILTVWAAGATFNPAQATVLTHTVLGTDNLYNTLWVGNPFPGGANSTGATDARSVQSGGVGFDFSPFASVLEIASGSVNYEVSVATDADGGASLFRGLPLNSLIGIWSATDASITAIGSAFFVGTSATLIVPNATSAYLFLAVNDGIYTDNSGQYSVRLTAVSVDQPDTAALLLLPMLLAGAGARLRRWAPWSHRRGVL